MQVFTFRRADSYKEAAKDATINPNVNVYFHLAHFSRATLLAACCFLGFDKSVAELASTLLGRAE